MNRNTLSVVVAAVVFLGMVPAARGLINPKFTPVHLVQEADTIATVAFTDTGKIGDKVEMKVLKALKGKVEGKMVIDLSKTPKDHAEAARKLLGQFGSEPAILFEGKNGEEPLYFVHAHGTWLQLSAGAGGTFALTGFDDGKMRETWNGGTDMLIRCVEYVLGDADSALVPSVSGTSWGDSKKIGTIQGEVRAIAAVDVAGDGTMDLFIASEKGDQLYRAGKGGFEDVTGKMKLQSASRLAAWGDFNGDGRSALASYDGKDLWIYACGADGVFSKAKAEGTFTLPADCKGLAAVGIGSGKGAGVLVSPSSGQPILLKPAGKGHFEAVVLPTAGENNNASKDMGKAQACVVGDFNGDSWVDIIQPFEKGGLFYAGNSAGGFDAPKACAVAGAGKAAVGDFDGDGQLDVIIVDESGMSLFQNRGKGVFEESLQYSGEVTKTQGAATSCGVADFNNDSRRDLFVTHHDSRMQIFFSRGFRSFGEAQELEGLKDVPDADQGQQAALFGDFRNAGAQDVVAVLNNGEVWWVANDLSSDNTLCVRARCTAKSAGAGPISVTLWKEARCLGSALTQSGGAAAYFGIQDAGQVTLKWTWPGGKEMSKTVTVDKPVDVLLEGN